MVKRTFAKTKPNCTPVFKHDEMRLDTENRQQRKSDRTKPDDKKAWFLRAISSERGLDLAWRREVLNTSVRALLSGLVTGGEEGFNGNRNQQNSLATMEPGKVETGAEILLRIRREFGKSIEWLPMGEK
jgi:hypothetical protein